VKAIACITGFGFEIEEYDTFGCDGCFTNLETGFKVYTQLKSTSNKRLFKESTIIYPLEVNNYSYLIKQGEPKILIVLELPFKEDNVGNEDEDTYKWIEQDVEKLILKKCCYYINLQGWKQTENTTSINIEIPRTNIFTPQTLTDFESNYKSKIIKEIK
jgi:hypothetical protein